MPNWSLNRTLCGGPGLGSKSLAHTRPAAKCRLARTLGPQATITHPSWQRWRVMNGAVTCVYCAIFARPAHAMVFDSTSGSKPFHNLNKLAIDNSLHMRMAIICKPHHEWHGRDPHFRNLVF